MDYARRIICLFTALCLLAGLFLSAPSFASSEAPPGADAGTPPEAKAPEKEPEKPAEDDESLWYSKKISMKKEHQKLLWDHCKKRKLEYIDMLALISVESNFNEKCVTKSCRGYFQISKVHWSTLSKTLKTLNKPLDGTININWGTAMYSWILADKRVKGLEGKSKRDAALSIFKRGAGGYDKYGLSKSYLKTFYKKRDIICSFFEQEK